MNPKKNILITRELSTSSSIRQWAADHNLHLIEKSFIETVAVTGLEIPKTDWIFFSSPRGAELYLAIYPINAKKIAALAEGTAEQLTELGYKPNFTGNSGESTRQIGQQFFAEINPTETVLFPLSDISRRAVSSQKGDHTIIELITYKTQLVSEKLAQQPDIILFTSPSNVDGFLLTNKVTPQTHMLAIGETTADHLRSLDFANVHVSKSTDEKALIKTLELILN